MYIPTFYFLRDNYPEDELEQMVASLKDCGARAVIVETGKSNNNLAKDVLNVVASHI